MKISAAGVKEAADMWMLPQSARPFAADGRIHIYRDAVVGTTIAHELGHTLFGLADEYDEQRRAGDACGQGPTFEAAGLSEMSHSIMQISGAQICVDTLTQNPRSFFNSLWWNVDCNADTDCANICTNISGGCPTTGFECPSPPPLFSELSVQMNHDPVRATNDACPEPKAGSILVLNARLWPFHPPLPAFDGSTFDSAAATSHFPSTLEVLDSLGRVTGVGVGQSSHLISIYFRARVDGTGDWDIHVLGRAEEFGGVEGATKKIAEYQLTFNPAGFVDTISDGVVVQPASIPISLVLGDYVTGFGGTATGPFAPGADNSVAPPVVLDVRFSGVEQACFPHPQGGCLGTWWKPGAGVFAGEPGNPGDMQRGSCTDQALCQAAWNSNTQRYETSAQTIAYNVSDWERMRDALAERKVNIDIPLALPNEVPPSPDMPPSLIPCGGDVIFDEAIDFPDQVMLVMDRSGSMAWKNSKFGAGEQTRLEFAQAAARAFVDLQERTVNPTGAQLGLISFSDTATDNFTTLATIDSTIPTPPGAAKPEHFKLFIDLLNPDGGTAIGDGLKRAREVLTAAPPSSAVKAVILLSDGENNLSSSCPASPPQEVCRWHTGPLKPLQCQCIDEDPVMQANALKQAGITVYTVPTGGAADRGGMAEIASLTGGGMFDAPEGDELPTIYAELFARTRGEALALARTPSIVVAQPVCGIGEFPCQVGIPTDTPRGCRCMPEIPPPIPEVEEFEVPVENDGQRLNIMLSARNADVGDWNPEFTLKDPNGAAVLTQNSPSIRSDAFYRILTVAHPAAGTWKLEVAATDTTTQYSYLLAHVENPAPGCSARATPIVTQDGKSVVVTALPSYGAPLGAGVVMTGTVRRPDDSTLNLAFAYNSDPTAQDFGYRATVPATEFRGRGIYTVVVRCNVPSDAVFQAGESIFAKNPLDPGPEVPPAPSGTVVPFVREAMATFFLDSSTFPPLVPGADTDGNGIPDSQEGDPTIDIDGDGLPDVRDTDDDNDDDPDQTDPEPKNPGCNAGTAGPPIFVFVPPPVHISTCPVATIGQATVSGCDVVLTNDAPASFPPGTTVVTWTATNPFGTVTATQSVTVELGDSSSCCPAGTNVIVGTNDSNVLLGTSGSDCILGLGGDDVIYGNGGSDFISGGGGNDTIDGLFSAPTCYVNGGLGNDVIGASPVTGACTLIGGPGNDVIDGGSGPDQIDAGDGSDVCHGAGGNDLIEAGAGSDTCDGGSGNDQISGGDGNDTLSGGAGVDTVDGGAGTDVCSGEVVLQCAP